MSAVEGSSSRCVIITHEYIITLMFSDHLEFNFQFENTPIVCFGIMFHAHA